MNSLPTKRGPILVLRSLICAALFCKGSLAVYNDSIFSFENSYPAVWWAVSSADRPTLANNAVRLRSDTYDRSLFARSIIVSLAAGERNEVMPLTLPLSQKLALCLMKKTTILYPCRSCVYISSKMDEVALWSAIQQFSPAHRLNKAACLHVKNPQMATVHHHFGSDLRVFNYHSCLL